MRTFPAAFVLALTITAAATAFAAEQRNAYAVLDTADAAACARACEEDTLCMAWTFRSAGQCSLAATSPGQVTGVAMGFATRAPAFMRAVGGIRTRALTQSTQQPVQMIEASAEPVGPAEARDDPAFALLGGPLGDPAPLQNR